LLISDKEDEVDEIENGCICVVGRSREVDAKSEENRHQHLPPKEISNRVIPNVEIFWFRHPVLPIFKKSDRSTLSLSSFSFAHAFLLTVSLDLSDSHLSPTRLISSQIELPVHPIIALISVPVIPSQHKQLNSTLYGHTPITFLYINTRESD
jgi:hypothetical protein